ncbi:MAG: flagellar protein FhlB [Gammaproteobacteria bacterium]|nr:MAG: flagellar protein FhlB [Gammaproteobacteria bacterium]
MKKKEGNAGIERAVALHYDGARAPRITASGRGQVAEDIVDLALEHGVPIQERPELARLLEPLPLGAEIPRTLYVAVAEVLAFAFYLSGRTPWDETDNETQRDHSNRDTT